MLKRLYVACLLACLLLTQCQPKVYSQPKHLTIEQLHKVITIKGTAGDALHGLVRVWYKQALKEGKSETEATDIAAGKLMQVLEELMLKELKEADENARKI